MQEVKEIGLKDQASSKGFPYLCSGYTIDDFHASGTYPDCHIMLKSSSSRGRMSVSKFLRACLVTPSKPGAPLFLQTWRTC